MIEKFKEKEKAIKFRRRGLSYSEILKEVKVAKSTLALWLRSVNLSQVQKQRITEKRLRAAHKGGDVRKSQRILLVQKIYSAAKKDIKKISQREFWLMGAMLYWAEGSKEKEGRPGLGVQFTNSDPQMIRLFIKWLFEICHIRKEEVAFDIFIHQNSKNNINKVIDHWSFYTGFSKKYFSQIYFKKNNIKTNRQNIGDSYFGTLKIRVKASSGLNRKIAGWTKGVVEYF